MRLRNLKLAAGSSNVGGTNAAKRIDVGREARPEIFGMVSIAFKLGKTEFSYVGNRYHEDVIGARNAGITLVLVERGRRHKTRDCLAVTGLLSLPSMLKENVPGVID